MRTVKVKPLEWRRADLFIPTLEVEVLPDPSKPGRITRVRVNLKGLSEVRIEAEDMEIAYARLISHIRHVLDHAPAACWPFNVKKL